LEKNAPRETEACSLVYGDTLEKDFSLILVIGREPNRHSNIIDKVAHYSSPDDASFWQTSHGLIARYAEMDARKFKSFCKNQNASPIVFSDASPVGLDNRFGWSKKRELRKAIPASVLEQHTQTVFSQSDIISRTAMVLVSGVEECGLAHAMPFIQQQCNTHKIPFAHIASLSAMTKKHTHEIRMEQIGHQGKLIIKQCTNTFLSGSKLKAA